MHRPNHNQQRPYNHVSHQKCQNHLKQALRRQWFAGLRGSEPRAAPYDNKHISVEESNLFCACHVLLR
jgi:hypothetical protein